MNNELTVGERVLYVNAYKGRVAISLSDPTSLLSLSPKEARDLAMLLRQQANNIERTPGL